MEPRRWLSGPKGCDALSLPKGIEANSHGQARPVAHGPQLLGGRVSIHGVLGVNESTVRRYLDLLTDALMLRQLQPYHANIGKRQVKSPKVYVRDSGLLHQLMGLDTEKALLEHPKAGASWEGFAIEQILSTTPHDDAWCARRRKRPADIG